MKEKEPHTQVFRLEEIHELTGISMSSLRRFCREGKLKAVKRARQWFVREEDYDAFFATEAGQEPEN